MDYQALAGMKNNTLLSVRLFALIMFISLVLASDVGVHRYIHISRPLIDYLLRFLEFLYPFENRTRSVL